uniref:Col_cuticle_N domain-containing protein n=1 Tax=Panagrellus redivivus TaxID=6233 RepID=A0A7E4ZYK6_PANRE
MTSTVVFGSVFMALMLVGTVISSPVYWLDHEKQFLYSFDDPEMIRYASHVEDRHQQPVFDIAAIDKRMPELRASPIHRLMSLRQLAHGPIRP